MPIPSPKPNESESNFISRCVEAISDEYPEGQAVAVCYTQWDGKDRTQEYETFKNFDRLSGKEVRKYLPIFEDAFSEAAAPVWENYNGDKPNPDLFDSEVFTLALQEMYKDVGVKFGLKTINEQKAARPFFQYKAETDYVNLLVEEMLLYFKGDAAVIVASINNVSKDVIRMVGDQVFQQAVEEGWGIRQTARALQSQFQLQSIRRARTIARTEVLRAASIGDLRGINQIATETGSRVQTTWIPTFDNTARPHHVALSGQSIIEGTQTFLTDLGNELRYPRDEKAPAEETINCRCTTSHRLI